MGFFVTTQNGNAVLNSPGNPGIVGRIPVYDSTNTIKPSPVTVDNSGNVGGIATLTVQVLEAVTTISTGDNIIMLLDQVVGTPTLDAGIEVTRGTSPNARVLWNETTDRWQVGVIGTMSNVLIASDFGNLTEATSSVLTITGGTGATLGNVTIQVASAGAAQNGVVTTGTQTLAGAKTFSSPVSIPYGTVSAPGLYFGTQTDTGFWSRSGVKEVTLSNNGVQTWYSRPNNDFAVGPATTKLAGFTVKPQPDVATLTGTTTVNGSTTITGSGTLFLSELGVGDRISVSTASSTYRTVKSITSDTSLTVDGSLGSGASAKTISRKRCVQRWDDANGAMLGMVNDRGRFHIGTISVWAESDSMLYIGPVSNSATNLLKVGPGANSYYFKIDSAGLINHSVSSGSTAHTTVNSGSGSVQEWDTDRKVMELDNGKKLNLFYGANNQNNLGRVGCVIHVDTTFVQSVDSTDTTLMTWDMPGNTVDSSKEGERVVFEAHGSCNESGGVQVYLGGTALGASSFPCEGASWWQLRGYLTHNGTDGGFDFAITFENDQGTTRMYAGNVGIGPDSGHALNILANDGGKGPIVQRYFTVRWEPGVIDGGH